LLARSHGYSGGNWSTHNFYFADGNGNVLRMVDASQAVVATYRYDPFGNAISTSGSLSSANVYRFSSKEIHANSGLYYYGYRFYDPSLQRWLNRDPIAEWGGINQYDFVANRPTGRIDLFGLLPAGDYSGWGGPPLPPGHQGPTLPSQGNCWRYACNDARKPGEDHSPFPAPGGDPGGTATCDQLKNGAKAFGAKDPDQHGNCPAGYYKVKLVLEPPRPPTGWNDYHWYRQDDDGTWSSKPGSGCVESGVKDPTADARRRGYTTDCGNLCIPNPGIDVDKGQRR
jgi:RHS repeat-associated protein